MLRCRADASPAPEYSWLHTPEARPWSGEQRLVEVVSRAGDMELTDIGYLEAGEYRCRASNRLGEEEGRIELSGEWIGVILIIQMCPDKLI